MIEKRDDCPICGHELSQAQYDLQCHPACNWGTYPAYDNMPGLHDGASEEESRAEPRSYHVGDAVNARPETLAFRCGDRDGVVEKIEGRLVLVRMTQSGRLVPFRQKQLYH